MASNKNLEKKIDNYNKALQSDLYGIDPKFDRENRKLNDDAKKALDNIRKGFSDYSSSQGLELLMIERIGKSTKNQIESTKSEKALDLKSSIDQITKLTASNQLGLINEIYMRERGRIFAYKDFYYIHNFISFLPQVLSTIANNIMAPDDFTGSTINPKYEEDDSPNSLNGLGSSQSDRQAALARERLSFIVDKYRLNSITRDMVLESLKLGDGFLGVFSLDREFSNMLNENETLAKSMKLTNESVDFSITDFKNLVAANFNNLYGFKNKEELLSEETYKQAKDYIANVINENVIFEENPLSLMEDRVLLEEDFSGYKREINESIDTVISPQFGDLNRIKHNKKNKKSSAVVTGSYLKRLDPSRIVKLYSDNTCYGYFYIETLEQGEWSLFSNLGFDDSQMGSKLFNFSYLQSVDIPNNSNGNDVLNYDPKVRLILDIFLKNISKKINKKYIMKNPDFKSMLFELLKKDYIIKNKIRIVYLAPDEVVHFYPELDTHTGYGISAYRGILFTAKFYVSVLLCNLMLKLSRSYERRTIFVDVGLANDMEEAVQSVIRDFKSKEIKYADTQSLDTILNMWGAFNDLVIPVKDGDSPIKIESTPGTTVEIENDLLEFLKKAILAGMGVPSAFIPMLDEVDFARTLSMANGNFLRDTMSRQMIYDQPVTKLLRIIYKNEYSYDKNDMTDYMKITNKFPKPATLGMSSLNEQISSADSVIQFLVNNCLPTEEGNPTEELKIEFTKLAMKEILTGFDITKYQKLIEEAKRAVNKKILERKVSEPDEEIIDNDEEENNFGEETSGGMEENNEEEQEEGNENNEGEPIEENEEPEEEENNESSEEENPFE